MASAVVASADASAVLPINALAMAARRRVSGARRSCHTWGSREASCTAIWCRSLSAGTKSGRFQPVLDIPHIRDACAIRGPDDFYYLVGTPLLHGKQPDWRKVLFSEYDYSMQDVRLKLNQPIEQCRLFMVFDGRWKYIHASGFRPMLYDLDNDPDEFADRGEDPACADIIARLQAALFDWALHPKMHITTPNAKIAAYADNQLQVKGGILIGIWDEQELAAIRAKIAAQASPS